MTGTVNVQARLDICSIATLARAYTEEGAFVKSKSDLLWKAVEHLVSMYESRGGIERFTDVYEALEYMDRVGMQLASSGRTKRQVQSAQVNQNAIADFGIENFGRPVTKKQLLSEEQEMREMYNTASTFMRERGMPVIAYEEYRRGMERKKSASSAEEPVNIAAFEEKENKRLAAEKAAYDPAALRAAMQPPDEVA